VPRAVLFDLEPGVIDAACASPLGELFHPGKIMMGPCCVATFVVNSEPHIGARPSARLCWTRAF
jgi:hypothetical protein